MSEERWIDVQEAASILRLTSRQVNRYGNTGRLRTKKAGRRVLYAIADVNALADELQVDIRPTPAPNSLARLDETNDRLQALAEGQQQIMQWMRQIEDAERRKLPPPDVPSKAELRQWMAEIVAEQEATRRPTGSISVASIITITLLVLLVIMVGYFLLTR